MTNKEEIRVVKDSIKFANKEIKTWLRFIYKAEKRLEKLKEDETK